MEQERRCRICCLRCDLSINEYTKKNINVCNRCASSYSKEQILANSISEYATYTKESVNFIPNKKYLAKLVSWNIRSQKGVVQSSKGLYHIVTTENMVASLVNQICVVVLNPDKEKSL